MCSSQLPSSTSSKFVPNDKLGGQALYFNGDKEYIEIPYDTSSAKAITMSMWIKPDTFNSPTYGYLNKIANVLGNGGFWLRDESLRNGGPAGGPYTLGITHYYGQSGTWDVITAPLGGQINQWYYVTFIIDAANGKDQLYLNGQLVGEKIDPNINLNNFSWRYLTLGSANWGGGAGYFHGAIDEVRAYNQALSPNDVTSLYNFYNSLPKIAGTWYYAGKQSSPASISQSGTTLTFTNENGLVSTGSFQDSNTVIATGWSNLLGNLNSTLDRIDWANGTYWTRTVVTTLIPTATITQTSSQTSSGETFTISWSSTNATSCNIQKLAPGNASTPAWCTAGANACNTSGSQNASPTVLGMHQFLLTCTGQGGSTTASVSHVVVAALDTTAPSQPSNLSASPISASQINLTWSTSSDLTVSGQITSGIAGYKVYRSDKGNTPIATPTTNSYSDTGLSSSTSYTYTVAAYDVAGNISDQSASVSVTTQVVAQTSSQNYVYLSDNSGPTKGSAYIVPKDSNDTLNLFKVGNSDLSDWYISQWSNPSPLTSLSGSADSFCSSSPLWSKTSATTRICWMPNGIGNYKVELAHDGGALPCGAGSPVYNPSEPSEFDLLIGNNPHSVPTQFQNSPTLDKLDNLKFSFGFQPTYTKVTVRCGAGTTNPWLDQTTALAALTLTNSTGQTLFYQLLLNRSNPNLNDVCSGNPEWFFSAGPTYGVSDYMGTAFGISCPKTGGARQAYNLDLMPRLKTLIQNSPTGMDKDLSHWKVGGFYMGSLIYGSGNMTTLWDNISLVGNSTATTQASQTTSQTPIASYTFDNNTANDSSGTNNGTLVGSPTFTTGKVGQAISLNGTTQYIKAPAPAVTAYPFTACSWAKLNNATVPEGADYDPVAIANTSGADEWWFGYYTAHSTTYIRAVANGQTEGTEREYKIAITPDTNWHHICAVYNDSTTYDIYYDGTKTAATSNGGPATTPNGLTDTYIGGFFYNTSTAYGRFPGLIDEVKVFNRALAASEVAALANPTPPIQLPLTILPSTITLPAGSVGSWTLSAASSVALPTDPQLISTELTLPQFYSPNIFYENGIYKMWAAAGDRIRYYTSPDSKTWSGGQTVFSARAGTWEDDGGSYEGITTGISDAKVIKNIGGHAYAMYYTAGTDPNTNSRGGLGVAFSNDGINWTRANNGNPIRTFSGGHTFSVKNFIIAGKHYLYFIGGGSATVAPDLRVAQDLGDGVSFTQDKILILGSNVYPLFYDATTNSCWMAQNSGNVASGPTDIKVFAGSDCFTTMGTQVASISSTQTGNASNFGAAAKEVAPDGSRLPNTTNVQLYFASGNQWGNWQPETITLAPAPPAVSSVNLSVGRVGSDLTTNTTPASTFSWLDNSTAPSLLYLSNTNPTNFSSIAAGNHTVYATDVSGYTETAGTCNYAIGSPECSVNTFNQTPTCNGSSCNLPMNVLAGQVSKVVFKYTATTQTTAAVNLLIGANYAHYLVSNCSLDNSGGIIAKYDQSGVRNTVQSQLATMYSNGVRSIRFIIWHMTDATGQTWGVIPSAGGAITEPYKTNLINYLTDIKNAGFARVTVSFGPEWTNAPDQTNYDSTKFNENWNFIASIRPLIKQYGPADTRIDLLNEGAPSAGVSTYNQISDYLTKMYQNYVTTFGTSDVTVSVIGPSDGGTNRLQNLINILNNSGKGQPNWYEVHIYNTADTQTTFNDLIAEDNILNANSLTQPLVIGEAYYNNQNVASGIMNFINSHSRKIQEVIEWPKTNSCSFVSPPYSVDNYLKLTAAKFSAGDRVEVNSPTTPVNVRSAPLIPANGASNIVGTKPDGQLGTIISGPFTTSDGITWWKIAYDDPIIGWSAENYLAEVPTQTPLLAYSSFSDNNLADFSDGQTAAFYPAGTSPTFIPNDKLGGQALYFNGDKEYIEIPYDISSAKAITMSMWIKPDTFNSPTYGYLNKIANVLGNGGFWLRDESLRNGGPAGGPYTLGITHYYGQSGTWDVITAPLGGQINQWYYVTFIIDAANGKDQLYLNGQLVGEKIDPNINLNNFSWRYLTLGSANWGGGAGYFHGAIDEVRAYSGALNAGEVKYLYNTYVKFSIGDRVQTTASLKVRTDHSAMSSLSTGKPNPESSGALGTVVGDSVTADGYNWWQINYDNGISGWSVENWLEKSTATPSSTQTSSSIINVSISAPSSGAVVSGTVNLGALVPSTGIAGVQFKLDRSNLGQEDTGYPYGIAWDSTTASNGYHTLLTDVRGVNGNIATSTFVTIKVNNAPISAKGLKIGDIVQVNTNGINVRSDHSTSALAVGQQNIGRNGITIEGPVKQDGYVWWRVNYNGAIDGWTAENFLQTSTPEAMVADAELPGATGPSVKNFGAVGDAKISYDGALTQGSNILTSKTANFTASDQGKTVLVQEEKASEIDTISPGVYPDFNYMYQHGAYQLFAKITKIISPTQVQLDQNSTNNVIDAYVSWGTDDSVAMQTAINAGNMFIPKANYLVRNTVVVPANRKILCESGAILRSDYKTASRPLYGNYYLPHATFALLNVNGVEISGCSFEGSNLKGIYAYPLQWSDFAINMANSDHNVIINNTISNFWNNAAIEMSDVSNPNSYLAETSADDNLVALNNISNGPNGIAIISGKMNVILKNILTDVSFDMEQNVNDNAASDNALIQNTIQTKNKGLVSANFNTRGDAKDRNNIAVGNYLNGGFLHLGGVEEKAFNNNIVGVTASGGDDDAPMFVEKLINSVVSGNTVDCSQYAASINSRGCLAIIYSQNNEFSGNTIKNYAHGNAVGLRGDDGVKVVNNTIQNNYGAGIYVGLSNSNVDIIGNTLTLNNMANSQYSGSISLDGYPQGEHAIGTRIIGNKVDASQNTSGGTIRLNGSENTYIIYNQLTPLSIRRDQQNDINTVLQDNDVTLK